MQHGASKKKGKVLVQEHVPKVKASVLATGSVFKALDWHFSLIESTKMCNVDHISPCPQDFYAKECWAHHPKPYADFVESKQKERESLEAERKRAIRF